MPPKPLLAALPALDEIAADAGSLDRLPIEVLAALSSRAAAIQSILAVALTTKVVENGGGATRAKGINDASGDTLLSAPEAAKRIGMSVHWLYHHANGLPFTVRQGRALRFSATGIDSYIRTRQGR